MTAPKIKFRIESVFLPEEGDFFYIVYYHKPRSHAQSVVMEDKPGPEPRGIKYFRHYADARKACEEIAAEHRNERFGTRWEFEL